MANKATEKETKGLLKEICKWFRYDPATGRLYWKKDIGRKIKAGSEAGYTQTDRLAQYRRVQLHRRQYFVHRLVWPLVFGRWPKDQIDHINHNGLDNRLSNLRDVTNQQNQYNTKLFKNNTSGVMGVRWYKRTQKWRAQINRTVHLGYFSDFRDAVAARKVAERKYGYHKNHGSKQ